MQFSDSEGNEKLPLCSTEDEEEDEEEFDEEMLESDDEDGEDDEDDENVETATGTKDAASDKSDVVTISDSRADLQIKIIPAQTYEITPMAFSWHGTSVNAVACSHTFKWVLSGTEDGWVRIWNTVATYRGAKSVPTHDRQHQPDNVSKAGVLLSAFSVAAHERATSDGPFIPSQRTTPVAVTNLAVHSEALWVLAGIDNGSINLYTLRHDEGKCHHVFNGHEGRLFSMSLSADERNFVTGGSDKALRFWSLDTGKEAWIGNGHGFHVVSTQFQPPSCNSTLLSTSHDGVSLIWDIRGSTEPMMKLMPTRAVKPWSKSSVWSRDGEKVYVSRKIAAFDEYDIRMGGRLLRTIQLPDKTGPVNTLLAMPNNKHIICASSDSLRLYNLQNKNETGTTIGLEDDETKMDTGSPTSEGSSLAVPYVIIPGRARSLISQMVIDPTGQFLITASGTKGLEERAAFSSFGAAAATTTNELLFYNVKHSDLE